jgi:hypothetical protein
LRRKTAQQDKHNCPAATNNNCTAGHKQLANLHCSFRFLQWSVWVQQLFCCT